MKRLFVFFMSVGLGFSSLVFSKSLALKDIHPISKQMLAFHVENNELNEKVVRRCFTLYIEQFDPLHTYLLQSEVDEYMHLSDKQLAQVVQRLMRRDYTDFERLNKVMQASICRSRKVREEALSSFAATGFALQDSSPKGYGRYPRNMSELKESNRQLVQLWIMMEMRGPHWDLYTKDEKGRAFALWEERQQKKENPYLFCNDEGERLSLQEENHCFAQNYLKAFSKSLDAHTMFFAREEVVGMRTSLHKQFQGIGIVVRESGKGPYIGSVVKGGPAERSQRVHGGDLLVAIDGERLDNAKFGDILKKLEGGNFTKVTLTLKKPMGGSEFDVALRRERITMDDQRLQYSYVPYGDGIIGTLTFDAFYDNGRGISADKDMRKAINELQKKGNLKGLIIDIRNNGGGFLSQAVKIAGLFVPKGVIAIAKFSTGEVQYSRDIDGRLFYSGPLVVLTSKGSASASEVIAQALQDYNAAIIVGDEYSYGKGSMKQID